MNKTGSTLFHSLAPRSSLRTLWLTALAAALLVGCATPVVKTRVEAPSGWAAQQQNLAQLKDWQLSGKLGVRQGDRIDSAVINNWAQEGPHFEIQLSSAVFGLGATAIRGTPDAIWLTRAGEDTLYSEQPEALIWEQVGWTLPLRYLLYWVKGIPAPTTIEDMRFDEAGHLYQLTQSDWTIRYDQYHATAPYPLPRKIVMEQPQVRLTLVINDWQLPAPSPQAQP